MAEPQSLPPQADVVVVGGGIVGCASAYYLAKRGVRALVLEKDAIGRAQSGRNWGFIRQQGRDPAEIPLMIEANRLWSTLEQELGADVEWVQGGNLALATQPQRIALFEDWCKIAREYGLDTRVLGPSQLTALIPSLGGQWLGGLFTQSDGHAEPRKATQAFCDAARALGADALEHCTVERIVTQDGGVSEVRTDRGAVRTKCVIGAAGAWSAKLLHTLGLNLPQRWVRSTVARTSAVPRITDVGVWAPTVAFRQRRDGTLNLGGGGWADHDVTLGSLSHARLFLPNYWKNRQLFKFHVGKPLVADAIARIPGSHGHRHPYSAEWALNPAPSEQKVRWTFDEFRKLFASIGNITITDSWAGYIDATPDALPVLGALERPRGLVLATGFSGHGFGLGPIAGRLVAEIVTDGKPSLDLRAFRFSRFAEGDIGEPRSVL